MRIRYCFDIETGYLTLSWCRDIRHPISLRGERNVSLERVSCQCEDAFCKYYLVQETASLIF